jgi:hypothetical protein
MRCLRVDVTLYAIHCFFSHIYCCGNVFQQFAVQERRLSRWHGNVLSEAPSGSWANCSSPASSHIAPSLRLFVSNILMVYHCSFLHEGYAFTVCSRPCLSSLVFFYLRCSFFHHSLLKCAAPGVTLLRLQIIHVSNINPLLSFHCSNCGGETIQSGSAPTSPASLTPTMRVGSSIISEMVDLSTTSSF